MTRQEERDITRRHAGKMINDPNVHPLSRWIYIYYLNNTTMKVDGSPKPSEFGGTSMAPTGIPIL